MNRIIAGLLMALAFSGQAFAGCVATITASTPSADFINNGDGTITNTKTKLMWKRCAEGLSGANCTLGTATTLTWQRALQQAASINAGVGFATFHDWRLPNIKELRSIVERQCVLPAVNPTVFPATPPSAGTSAVKSNKIWFWSASPSATFSGFAWSIDFDSGRSFVDKEARLYYVRLVRGGQ